MKFGYLLQKRKPAASHRSPKTYYLPTGPLKKSLASGIEL